MNKNKKGLSEVVTAVLMIIGIVAAISVIWVSVRQSIASSSGGLSKAEVCLKNIIEPASCSWNEIAGPKPYNAGVSVKRVKTTLTPSANKLSLLDAKGNEIVKTSPLTIPENDGSITLEQWQGEDKRTATKAETAVLNIIYTLPDGSKVTCASQQIKCKKANEI